MNLHVLGIDLGEILDPRQMIWWYHIAASLTSTNYEVYFPARLQYCSHTKLCVATSFPLTIHFFPKQSVNYGVSRGKGFLAAGYKNLQMAVQPWAIRFVDPHRTQRHSSVESKIYYLCKEAQIFFT